MSFFYNNGLYNTGTGLIESSSSTAASFKWDIEDNTGLTASVSNNEIVRITATAPLNTTLTSAVNPYDLNISLITNPEIPDLCITDYLCFDFSALSGNSEYRFTHDSAVYNGVAIGGNSCLTLGTTAGTSSIYQIKDTDGDTMIQFYLDVVGAVPDRTIRIQDMADITHDTANTALKWEMGTNHLDTYTSADIRYMDAAGNAMMEIDPNGERIFLSHGTTGIILAPLAPPPLTTRFLMWEEAAATDCNMGIQADNSSSCSIHLGGGGGITYKGEMIFNGGDGTDTFGAVRPVTSANFRLKTPPNVAPSGSGLIAAWLLERYTAAGTGNSAGYGDIFRFETLDTETAGGRQTRHIEGCIPFWITYSTMQQVVAQNLNQVLPTNLTWANGTAPNPYNDSIEIPTATATNTPIGDFSACCTRYYADDAMGAGGGEVLSIGSRYMGLDTGTGCYRIEMVIRIYNRTGTGTEPSVQFQLYYSTTTTAPVWTQSNKVFTCTLEENVAAVGRTSWTSVTAVWYVGANHGNAFKIMAARETNATSTDPVYVDAESTTLCITKLG